MTVIGPGARIGPYEIEELVGAGGMGEVYRARDTRLERDVALKVLPAQVAGDPIKAERLLREARVISSLSHAHIRAIHEATEYDGLTVIVMEYLSGETLDHRLGRKPVPLAQALTYAEQLAGALDAAHSEGVVHHDIKPSNVMLTSRGAVLLDFGIARQRHSFESATDGGNKSTVTDSGSVPGTTAYMAPEQLDGSIADPRSDIFSLGVVLYEMLAGRKPFEGPTRARVIAAILEHEPAPLSSATEAVPPALERAVLKCLAKDPGDRWQTARDLASELGWIAHSASAAVLPATAFRSRVIAGGLLSVAAVLTVLAVIAVRQARPTADVPRLAGPVRFLATAPPNSVISVDAGAFTISPNGHHLAFTASSGGGPTLLWIRALDSFDAHPLSGTDGAGFPFWSPDGRAVAFFAGGQLKTIDIDGSPLQLVAEVSAQWGSWGSKGDIVFTTGEGVYRVRASGGAPQAILADEGSRGLRFGGPEFLPDGDHFLLGVIEPDKPQNQVSIYIGSLTNALEQPLLRADSQAIYAAPGYILYMRAGSLIAQPFDAVARRTTGEPISLPEPAAFVRPQRRASFSVSQTNVLAYRQGITTSQLTWFDRSGRRMGTVGAPGRYVNPAIAPDASRIAVTRLSASPSAGSGPGDKIRLQAITESDIWMFEPRGERPLTDAKGMEDYAVWSPDGSRIAYASNQTGFLDMYVKDAAASADEAGTPVMENNHQKLPMDWLADGKQLVFLDSAGGILPRLPLVAPIGAHGHATDVTLAANPSASLRSEDQVQVSPDGKWMAYVSDATGSAQVYVRQFPAGQRRWQVSTDGGFEPKWRGDGREMFYIASDQQMMSVAVTVHGTNFDAGRPTPLFRATVLGAPFQNGFVRNEYAVTRDGQRFLLNEPTGGTAAYAIRVLVNWQNLLGPGRE
jgi:Tol biopolymer transport system component